jgi:CheY-like chemotaxis protein
MKTLVIDDQHASLQVMKDLLSFWSFDVTLVSSGEEGLQAILDAAQSGHPFDYCWLTGKCPVWMGSS